MKKAYIYLLSAFTMLVMLSACSSLKPGSKYEEVVEMRTDSGTILLRLYDETPKHKENFLKLVKDGFYDSLLFHRVINGFMIQGGDPNSKFAGPYDMLGNGDVGYRIPAEFNPRLYHKKGALAAARDGNPEKASSGCQFYIVQGAGPIDSNLLSMYSSRSHVAYTDTQKLEYARIGGTPHLDANYTVFGEVISGLPVVDKIASVQVGANSRPVGNVRMYMRVIKMKKSEITKLMAPPKTAKNSKK